MSETTDQSNNIVKLETDRLSDQEYADAVKAQIRGHLEAICLIVERTRHERGFIANFQMGIDLYGRACVQMITVVKPL